MSRDYDELSIGQRTTTDILIKLTKDERIDRGRALAETLDQLESIEFDKKAATEAASKKSKEVRTRQQQLRSAVRSGEEFREVPVHAIADWHLRRVRVIRLDTFEVLFSRPMTDDERQRPLFDERKAAKGEKTEESPAQIEPADNSTALAEKSVMDLPVAPPPPPNIAQCQAAGTYYGRSHREEKGARIAWAPGLYPTPEQLTDLQDMFERQLNAEELTALVEAWKAEACEAEVPAPPAEVVPPEVMKARLAQMKEIGAGEGRSALAHNDDIKRPASERGRGQWPSAAFWQELSNRLGREFTEEEKQACVLAYEDEAYEPIAAVPRADVLNGEAPKPEKKRRKKKRDDQQPPAAAT